MQQLAIKAGIVPKFEAVDAAVEFWKSADGITEPGTETQCGAITTETVTKVPTTLVWKQRQLREQTMSSSMERLKVST